MSKSDRIKQTAFKADLVVRQFRTADRQRVALQARFGALQPKLSEAMVDSAPYNLDILNQI